MKIIKSNAKNNNFKKDMEAMEKYDKTIMLDYRIYKDSEGNKWRIYMYITGKAGAEVIEYYVQKEGYGIIEMLFGIMLQDYSADIEKVIEDRIEDIMYDEKWT